MSACSIHGGFSCTCPAPTVPERRCLMHGEPRCYCEDELDVRQPPARPLTDPLAAWQRCPICEGRGAVFGLFGSFQAHPTEVCPTCRGWRIVSVATGRPPEGAP